MQLTPVGPSLGPATGYQLHQSVGRVLIRPCCSSTCSSRTGLPSRRALQQQGGLALPQQTQHSSRSSRLRSFHLRSRLLCSAAAAASGAGSEDSSSQQQAHVDLHHHQQQQHQAQQPQQQLPPSQRLLSLLGRALGPAMLLAVAAAVAPRPSHAAAAASSRYVGALILLLHVRRIHYSFTLQQYASFKSGDSTTDMYGPVGFESKAEAADRRT